MKTFLIQAIPLCYISMVYFNTVLNTAVYITLTGICIKSR